MHANTLEHTSLPSQVGGLARLSPQFKFLFPSSLQKDSQERTSSLQKDKQERTSSHQRDDHERTGILLGSSDAAAGHPAVADTKPTLRMHSDEISSVHSSLQQAVIQQSIDEIRQSQETHQQSVQAIMEQVLQLLSPTASPQHSLWVFFALEMASIREELQQVKACLEPQKMPEPVRTSELPGSSEPPRLLHDGGLKEDDHSLPAFIQRELESVKAAMISEVHASRVECLANVESMRKAVEQRSNGDKNKEWQVPEVGDVALLTEHDREEAWWSELQDAVEEMDMEHHLYSPVMSRYLGQKSVWHRLFSHFHCSSCLVSELPSNALARAAEHPIFIIFQTMLILANTAIMGYEADAAIKAALQEPAAELPEWLDTCNVTFTILFSVELLFRIVALRSWFFVAPYEWGWNVFDVFVVLLCLIVDFTLTGVNLSFARSFRILRAVRVARVCRVLRFFRQLRRMLFAILSSLSSLMWFFVFLTMIVFMFSILLLQGLVFALDDMPYDPQGQINLQNCDEQQGHANKRAKIKEWYGSISSSMFTLVCAVTGGADWTILREPLVDAGRLYTFAFLIYILFVTVGIVNVLTGIFVHSSADVQDQSLIILNEQIKVDRFVKQMTEIFGELDESGTGKLAWSTFKEAMKDDRLQAYLSSHDLEPTHGRLIFDLLDVKKVGSVDITDFVMGMLRLKGQAKAIDARTIQRQVSMLPRLLDRHFKAVAAAHVESLNRGI